MSILVPLFISSLLLRLSCQTISLNLCTFGEPNQPTQTFLDDGFVYGYTLGAIQKWGITCFGQLAATITKEIMPYKITYPVSRAGLNFTYYLIGFSTPFTTPQLYKNGELVNDATAYYIANMGGGYALNKAIYDVMDFDPTEQWELEMKISGNPYYICEYCIQFFNCSTTCRNCSFTDQNICTMCYDHATLIGGECICNIGYYWNATEPCEYDDVSLCFQCLPCSDSCKGCNGPLDNQCNLCDESMFLESGSCVPQCPANKFSFYDGTGNNSCLDQCPPDTWLLLTNKTCIFDCQELQGFFNDLALLQCGICDGTCLTCLFTASNCTKCPSSFFLFENTCVEVCPNATYQDSNENSCYSCFWTCAECYSANNCSDCVSGFYLDQIENICSSNCPLGFFPDDNTSTCLSCGPNCLQCSNNAFCNLCSEGFDALPNGLCEKTKPIVPLTLLPTNQPLEFILNFNDSPVDLTLEPIGYQIISQQNPLDYKIYSLQTNETNPRDYSCQLIFTNISLTNVLLPFTLQLDDSKTSVKFNPNPVSSFINLNSSATLNTVKIPINFSLGYLNNNYPILVTFFFENNNSQILNFDSFQGFFYNVISTAQVKLPGFSKQQYELIRLNSTSFIVIQINFTESIAAGTLLNFSLPQFSFETFNNVSLVRFWAEIPLLKVDVLSNSTIAAINATSTLISSGTKTASVIAQTSMAMNTVNMMSVRLFTMLDMLQFYRYLSIKFPENMMGIFISEFSFQSLTIMDFPVDPRDLQPEGNFYDYGISTYFLNNANICLFQLAGTYLFGLGVIFLARKSKFFKEAVELNWRTLKQKFTMSLFLKCSINILSKLMVWNFVVTQFLSSFNQNLLYIFVTFKWPPLISKLGQANFITAVVFFSLLMFFLIFIFQKIRKIQKILSRNEVLPFNDLQQLPLKPIESKSEFTESPNRKDKNWDFSDFFDLSPGFMDYTNNIQTAQNRQVVPWDKIRYLDREINTASSQKAQRPKFSLKIPVQQPKRNDYSLEETTARTTSKKLNSQSNSPSLPQENHYAHAVEEFIMRSRYFFLFKNGNRHRPLIAYFIFVELGRQFIITLVLTLAWDSPIFASIFVESINFMVFLMVLFLKPYQEKKDWMLALIGDLGLNIGGVICVFLAVMDHNEDNDFQKRLNLGWIFVVANLIMMVLVIVIFIIQLWQFLSRFCRFMWRFFRNKRKTQVRSNDYKENEEKEDKNDKNDKNLNKTLENPDTERKPLGLGNQSDEKNNKEGMSQNNEMEEISLENQMKANPFNLFGNEEVIHNENIKTLVDKQKNNGLSPKTKEINTNKSPKFHHPQAKTFQDEPKKEENPQEDDSPPYKNPRKPTEYAKTSRNCSVSPKNPDFPLQNQDFVAMSLREFGQKNDLSLDKTLMRSCDSPSKFHKAHISQGFKQVLQNQEKKDRKNYGKSAVDWDTFFKN